MTAWAKGGSGQGFDPSNPPDPQMGYRLTVKTAPEGAGTTNPERATYVPEGEYVYCTLILVWVMNLEHGW